MEKRRSKYLATIATIATVASLAGFGIMNDAAAETLYQLGKGGGFTNGNQSPYAYQGTSDTPLTAGYAFTVAEEDILITELAKWSGNAGNLETVTLYNADTGEVLASVSGVSNSDDWEYFALDSPIVTDTSTTYAVIGSFPLESDTLGVTNEHVATDADGNSINYIDNYFFREGRIVAEDSLFALEQDVALEDLYSIGFGGFEDIDIGITYLGNPSGPISLDGGIYGLVDVGTVTLGEFVENGGELPVIVPTPSAMAAGMISLGMLMIRRRRKGGAV
ncbi:hypothetical protein [Poriferisphaera sp. WC338]|uniref:hypothetical protein n=1 Tax=Poriferisphaera sp. WC338 TaxID=3425129 RepID=UPI003D81B2AB